MTLNVTLPPELAAFLNTILQQGRYSSTDEVIASALEILRTHETFVSQDVHELRREAAVGAEDVARGEVEQWNVEELKAEGRRMLAAKRRSGRGTGSKG
jgi:putative addiction module CopG family antidote